MTPIRLAVLCDYAEEHWPSMDLVAEMMLQSFEPREVRATRIQPAFRNYPCSHNANRLLNRLVAYPLEARACRGFDLFHVVDHSYAQLVHALPAGRSVVTCHDADTFRCLFHPATETRPWWFRAMARHILGGLQKAACVVCVSEATRSELLQHGFVDPARIQVIHNGVHPAFTPQSEWHFDAQAAGLLGPVRGAELLHVGSTIPRKRIDALLRIFAECRAQDPALRLIRVGAPFTQEQLRLSAQLGLDEHIAHLGHLPAKLLAAIYRRAALLLIPSGAEGFGLPLVEAMSCGTPAVVSDIPSLREVGADAAERYPVGDIPRWSEGVLGLLEKRAEDPDFWYQRTAICRRQAALFSWERNARELTRLYRTLLTQS